MTTVNDPVNTLAPTKAVAPYVSIIATARNDNHGGDLLGRMQLFLDSLLDQCERYDLLAELILVEWNPPRDRPPLAQALTWPRRPGRCTVRVITVPGSAHRRFEHSDALPLFQMIAKNVGIRRARGRFILATNVDILFSDELIRFIATRRLRRDRMYRCDRHDVDPHPPRKTVPHSGHLDWCSKHVVRVNERHGSTRAADGQFHRIYWDPTPRVRFLEWLQDLRLVPVVTRRRLHCNACGDFTLMHRDGWSAVRGYAQFAMYSMHIDSLLCTAAHFAGWREAALKPPMVTYHLEHASGSGWSPEGQATLNTRLEKAGVPQVTLEQYHRWSIQMRRDRKPALFNDEDWGLAGERFEEVSPTQTTSRDREEAVSEAETARAEETTLRGSLAYTRGS